MLTQKCDKRCEQMAVIAFVNPKGGSGKTTLSMVLAEQYAKQGLSVALIDTDPNGFHKIWLEDRPEELGDPGFTIMFEPEELNVIRTLEDAAEKFDLVLVDTEGTSSKTVTRVISRTHLVVVPINPSTMDAKQASRAVRLIKDDAHMLGRDIEFRLIFSRTKNIRSRTHRNLVRDLENAGLPVLETQMTERAAFLEIFEYSATIQELIEDAQSDLSEAQTALDALLEDSQEEEAVQKENKKQATKQKAAVTAATKKIESHGKAAVNAQAVAAEITTVLTSMAEVA